MCGIIQPPQKGVYFFAEKYLRKVFCEKYSMREAIIK
jgi:hypothetical protein